MHKKGRARFWPCLSNAVALQNISEVYNYLDIEIEGGETAGSTLLN